MKDMPFFLLKNSLGAKMKKGIKTFCNNNGSTSTLNQQNNNTDHDFFITSKVISSSPTTTTATSKQNSSSSPPTLEDLILQLELEEETARKKSKLVRGRRSCVNNSDILRSARNAALNQYPRFSLDGRDAMYRSSFGNNNIIEGTRRRRSCFGDLEYSHKGGVCCLPPTVAGESVVWRKPGVVAKLMGLEAMPVPIGGCSSKRSSCDKERLISDDVVRRRRFERHDDLLERKVLAMEMQQHQGYHHNHNHNNIRRSRTKNNSGCCSKNNGYCIMKPVALEALAGGPGRRSYA